MTTYIKHFLPKNIVLLCDVDGYVLILQNQTYVFSKIEEVFHYLRTETGHCCINIVLNNLELIGETRENGWNSFITRALIKRHMGIIKQATPRLVWIRHTQKNINLVQGIMNDQEKQCLESLLFFLCKNRFRVKQVIPFAFIVIRHLNQSHSSPNTLFILDHFHALRVIKISQGVILEDKVMDLFSLLKLIESFGESQNGPLKIINSTHRDFFVQKPCDQKMIHLDKVFLLRRPINEKVSFVGTDSAIKKFIFLHKSSQKIEVLLLFSILYLFFHILHHHTMRDHFLQKLPPSYACERRDPNMMNSKAKIMQDLFEKKKFQKDKSGQFIFDFQNHGS